mgnify:CR=1 FL=1
MACPVSCRSKGRATSKCCGRDLALTPSQAFRSRRKTRRDQRAKKLTPGWPLHGDRFPQPARCERNDGRRFPHLRGQCKGSKPPVRKLHTRLHISSHGAFLIKRPHGKGWIFNRWGLKKRTRYFLGGIGRQFRKKGRVLPLVSTTLGEVN